MNTPIINPATLSELQRERIKERHALMKVGICECEAYELSHMMDEYKLLFGSEFLKKGE